MSKLADLLDLEAMSEEDFLMAYTLESVVPGICMNKDCDATYEYEPDQTKGWCEVCETNSVKSGLVLIGVI